MLNYYSEGEYSQLPGINLGHVAPLSFRFTFHAGREKGTITMKGPKFEVLRVCASTAGKIAGLKLRNGSSFPSREKGRWIYIFLSELFIIYTLIIFVLMLMIFRPRSLLSQILLGISIANLTCSFF